jgi:hypothetical protein
VLGETRPYKEIGNRKSTKLTADSIYETCATIQSTEPSLVPTNISEHERLKYTKL